MSNKGKQVGEPCHFCQQPLIEGRNGAYCKPCYIAWKNKQEGQTTTTVKQDPDWEAISRGKVRHGVVCAMLQAGKGYEDIVPNLKRFEDLIMNGVSDNEPVPSDDDLPPF